MFGRIFLFAVLMVALPSQAAPSTGQDKVSTKDFFRQYALRSARISPDGKVMAVIQNLDGDFDQLVLKEVDSGIGGVAYTVTEKGGFVGNLRWISNDFISFNVYKANDQGWMMYAAQWQGIQNGVPHVHLDEAWGAGLNVVDPLQSQGTHALVSDHLASGQSVVYNIDFSTPVDQFNPGHEAGRIDGDAFLWLADQQGAVGVVGTYGSGGAREYWVLRQSTGHWYQFRTVKPGEVFWPVSYADDGKNLIIQTDLGHQTSELWTYDPLHDKFLTRVYGDPSHDLDDFAYDWYAHKLTGVIWYQGSLQRQDFFDSQTQSAQGSLEKLFPDHLVEIIDSTHDRKRTLALISDSKDPGTFYVYDAESHKTFDMGKVLPWLPETELAQVESNTVDTSDGLKIEYLVAVPPHAKAPYPVVVMPHGGPLGVLDSQNYDSDLQLLANRGFAVIQVNYRGSGGGTKQFYDAGKGQWGQKIEDDIETAVRAALKKYALDAERVCIYGESYGGYSALMSTIRDPALYKCAASMSGVMDIPLLYQTSDWSTNPEMRKLMIDITGNPDTQLDQLTNISPVYIADKLNRPVFIAQGALDERVDQEQAYRMKAALAKLGKPYKFQIYQNEGHGFQYLDTKVDFYDQLVSFLNESLNPVPPKSEPKSKVH